MIHGFRVRDTLEDEYIDGDFMLSSDGLHLYVRYIIGLCPLDMETNIIEPSTGLPDSKGVIVHDGDIARHMRTGNICEVSVGDLYISIYDRNLDQHVIVVSKTLFEKFEIIGTIHDEEFRDD